MSEELLRNDEPGDEAEVEGHRMRRAANDEPAAEGEDDDEVEAHRLRKDTLRKD
jgi:hypothetical protein